MKKLFKKLRSKAGESLVETLCAILIFTLASVAMYSMVMAAGKINAEAKKADAEFQEKLTVVEKAEGDGIRGHVVMTIDSGDGTPPADRPSQVIYVDVYQIEDTNAYFRANVEGGGE